MNKIARPALFSLLTVFLICPVASAQDYVVTLSGDTLYGQVRHINNSTSNQTSSQFVRLVSSSGKKTTYPLLKTRAFRLNNQVYHTVRMHDRYTFMKLIQEGYLSLYHYQPENQTNWDGRYLLKRDGSSLDVPNIGFKKRVTEFLKDCQEVANRVETGAIERTELDKLVDEYNACITQRTSKSLKAANEKNAWSNLAEAVKGLADFAKKSDALEMIREINLKVSAGEKVPSFLVNGLKDALKDQPAVTEKLEEALAEIH